ncbi:hypothetical protein ABZ934_23130 [Streptomyces sp. NPDC046557]
MTVATDGSAAHRTVLVPRGTYHETVNVSASELAGTDGWNPTR